MKVHRLLYYVDATSIRENVCAVCMFAVGGLSSQDHYEGCWNHARSLY